MPRRSSRNSLPELREISFPRNSTRPPLARTEPLIARNSVVFPAPLRPTTATRSPGAIDSDRLHKMGGASPTGRTSSRSTDRSGGASNSEHREVTGNLLDRRVLRSVGADEMLAAENREDLVVTTRG